MAVAIVDGGNASSTYTGTLDGGDAFTLFGPELTPVPDATPVPSVQVSVADVLPETVAVDLYRIADGRTALVRGGIRKYAVGGTTVIDWEAPFGVPITYRAEMFSDAAGTQSLGFTSASETFLEVTDTWVQQPLNPGLSVRALRLQGTAADLVRVTPGDLVYVQGAELATWVGGQRRGLSAVAWDLLVDSTVDADRMQAVFGAYGTSQSAVLCIRTPPPMRVPRTLYLAVSELHELDVDVAFGGETVRYTFTGTEARPPAPGLVVATLRRMDIDAAYPTRDARASAYLTRNDRDSDYTLAGVAGDA
ncbi:hypothetical protein [Curtobacterium sp. MCSS17_015]|uniref:hypothetical protein n=1 Tax=Curtobacterium sp. MCSS17_015 TaxID=2175666 RepID=UPI000DA98838|nr:hypothetical protein [Curtobacterium sp. MCSS17_015]WIB25809.1 hypothetical protein DEJ18_12225 [Curtobacterium sp. MCSS17_015]